jgi:glycosyltransferase involved in cell wall biosynthesis
MNAFDSLKRHQDCDVLHYLNSVLVPTAGFLKNRVKIATTHFFVDSYISLSPHPNRFMGVAESLYSHYVSMLDRSPFKSLDCLVACTDYQADCIEKQYGLSRSKMRTIPPGIDTGFFRKLHKSDLKSEYGCEKVVLYCGRLHERSKGLSYLIKAMRHIERKDMVLLIVGDGPDRRHYERLVRSEGLESRIRFLGRLDFRTKCIIQKSADVAVVPSIFEVFGTVFAESLACGVPVVAFDMPFWKGLYDGAAFFARPRDEAALALEISRALEDMQAVERLRRRGAELSQLYDFRRTVDSYVGLYEELAGRP